MLDLLRNAFLLLFLVWLGGFAWFLTLIPYDSGSSPAGTADAVVVLTGGAMRLEHGFELLTRGRAPRMFISGVEDGLTLPALLRKKEFLPFAGAVRPETIELGYLARTTIGNAEETAQWAAQRRIKSILLVTGNYHMPRSVYELHQAMPDIAIIPDPVFPSYFAHNAWWRHADGIRLVISEYHKYITSVVVYTLLEKT